MQSKPTRAKAHTRKPSTAPSPKGAHSHQIRIIGGQWKRTKLKVASKEGLRPTPDRVRETLFNWLGQDLGQWRCVDVFAGTGALGLEAASRGAKAVLLVEHDAQLVAELESIKQQLAASAVQIQRGDGVSALKQQAPASCDLIFLDPPFDAPLLSPALQAATRVLAPDGFVYLEAPTLWTDALLEPMGFVVYRHLKAGAVHAHLLRHVPRV
jgi:16S rRNA (guanine(966)-N(2))-methyltransferase RsmD